MNLKEFTEKAIRTESVPEEIVINGVLFNEFKEAFLHLASCLDMMKKNAFYSKEIKPDDLMNEIRQAMFILGRVQHRVEMNPNSIGNTQASPINPREFHGALGLATEAAEILELVSITKEHVDKVDAGDELGDNFWYIAILADALGLDLENQVLPAVINKLAARYPEKFDAARAIDPDKAVEKEVTAQTMDFASDEVEESLAEDVLVSTAMSREDELEEMTVVELRDLASDLDIDGRSAWTRKSELVEGILAFENESNESESA